MARGAIWTSEDTRVLHELNAEGLALGIVAERMGKTKATVSRRARELALTWPTPAAKDAIEVQKWNAETVRADIQDDLLLVIQDQLARLRTAGEFKELIKGEYGAEVVKVLDFIPARSLSMMAKAIRDLIAAIRDLAELSKDSNAGSDLDRYLSFMMGADPSLADPDYDDLAADAHSGAQMLTDVQYEITDGTTTGD